VKSVLLFLALGFGMNAFADNVCNPVINVNGCCAQACKPKTVVKVKKVIVEKIVEKKVVVEKIVEVKRKAKRNRINLLAGVGPTKIEQTTASEVSLRSGAIGGAQYQRTFSEDSNFNWLVQGTTGFDGRNNSTVLGGVGYEF
jgi:hypothetical protein